MLVRRFRKRSIIINVHETLGVESYVQIISEIIFILKQLPLMLNVEICFLSTNS